MSVNDVDGDDERNGVFRPADVGVAESERLPKRCKRCRWQTGRRPDTCWGDGDHDFEFIPEAEWTPYQRQYATRNAAAAAIMWLDDANVHHAYSEVPVSNSIEAPQLGPKLLDFPTAADDDPDIITLLERRLAQARNGEFDSIVIITTHGNDWHTGLAGAALTRSPGHVMGAMNAALVDFTMKVNSAAWRPPQPPPSTQPK